jgi:chromosome partitioning protein
MARDSRKSRPAHVIVLGNEKGGSGKSTTAMHIIVALLKSGARVASIDTDGRQRSLTRYVENRAV